MAASESLENSVDYEGTPQNGHVRMAVVVMLSLFSVVGVVGNAIAFYIFFSRKSASTSITFILALAGTDCFTCLVTIPYTIVFEVLRYRLVYDLACKTYMFLITSTVPFSAYIMVAIALDRYFCICHPFLYVFTVPRAKAVIFSMSIPAVIFGTITALSHGAYVYEVEYPDNSTGKLKGFLQDEAELKKFGDMYNLTQYKLVHYKQCVNNTFYFSTEFNEAYRKVHALNFLFAYLSVAILYILIYKSIFTRRLNNARRKKSNLYPTPGVKNKETPQEETQMTVLNGGGSQAPKTMNNQTKKEAKCARKIILTARNDPTVVSEAERKSKFGRDSTPSSHRLKLWPLRFHTRLRGDRNKELSQNDDRKHLQSSSTVGKKVSVHEFFSAENGTGVYIGPTPDEEKVKIFIRRAQPCVESSGLQPSLFIREEQVEGTEMTQPTSLVSDPTSIYNPLHNSVWSSSQTTAVLDKCKTKFTTCEEDVEGSISNKDTDSETKHCSGEYQLKVSENASSIQPPTENNVTTNKIPGKILTIVTMETCDDQGKHKSCDCSKSNIYSSSRTYDNKDKLDEKEDISSVNSIKTASLRFEPVSDTCEGLTTSRKLGANHSILLSENEDPNLRVAPSTNGLCLETKPLLDHPTPRTATTPSDLLTLPTTSSYKRISLSDPTNTSDADSSRKRSVVKLMHADCQTNSVKRKRPLTARDRHHIANIKTAFMLFIVTLVFAIAFLPALLMANNLISLNLIVFYGYFIYNVINPFIYAFMNQTFRDDLKKLVIVCQR